MRVGRFQSHWPLAAGEEESWHGEGGGDPTWAAGVGLIVIGLTNA